MAFELFTAGEIRGITRLPAQTIRRYVNDFSEFFSEPARIPTKGRRFNGQDIKTLLIIRNMKSTHAGNDKILATLQDKNQLANTARFEELNAVKILSAAREDLKQARQEITAFQTVRGMEYLAARETKHLVNKFEKSLAQRDEMPDIIKRLDGIENAFKRLLFELNFERENKPFLAKVLGL